jgi:hypothetical protein
MARIYEKIIDNRQLYSSKKISVPRPEFIVLYTGKEDFPAVKTLKLSDLFKETGEYDKVQLELEVTVYNINKGINPEIERRSPTLGGYAGLVAKARENESAGMNRSEAVKEAVSFCKSRGMLTDFLKRHGSEQRKYVTNGMEMERRFTSTLGGRHGERQRGRHGGRQKRNCQERVVRGRFP